MWFHSYIFWTYFLVVLALYRILPFRGQNFMLLAASYVFYGSWDWRFLSLIWLTTCVDYTMSRSIVRATNPSRRKLYLCISLVTNLGILGFFKYYGFFVHEFTDLMTGLGVEISPWTIQVVLPAGISFYTFQTMSYTLDVYRGRVKPAANLMDFALYICFFPQLVAGPIERYEALMPQIANPRPRRDTDFSQGLYHVMIGMFKKLVIADNMAMIVNHVFAQKPDELTAGACLAGVYAFAFQVYGDFSAYSSIAQGVAKWMGFDLMVNFRMPYFAINPSDFWQRWHISLSSWLRDYLYIPLGGNRGGQWFTMRNLMLTMLLGGLWHGAGWAFILWGGYHGLLLIVYRVLESRGYTSLKKERSLPMRIFMMVVTFHLICYSWLLFRAGGMAEGAVEQVTGMTRLILTDWTLGPFFWYTLGTIGFYCGPLMIFEAWVEKRGDMIALTRTPWGWRAAFYSYLAGMMMIFPPMQTTEFIYFQF